MSCPYMAVVCSARQIFACVESQEAFLNSAGVQELKNGRVAMLAAMGLPAASLVSIYEHGPFAMRSVGIQPMLQKILSLYLLPEVLGVEFRPLAPLSMHLRSGWRLGSWEPSSFRSGYITPEYFRFPGAQFDVLIEYVMESNLTRLIRLSLRQLYRHSVTGRLKD